MIRLQVGCAVHLAFLSLLGGVVAWALGATGDWSFLSVVGAALGVGTGVGLVLGTILAWINSPERNPGLIEANRDHTTDLASLLTQLEADRPETLVSDRDFNQFGVSGIALCNAALGRAVVPDRPVWDETVFAEAMRHAAANGGHIDRDIVPPTDHKVFMLLRKAGLTGLEGALAGLGARRTYALIKIIAGFADWPYSAGNVPFGSSCAAWIGRAAYLAQTLASTSSCPLQVLTVGPNVRRRLGRMTVVMDVLPAPHEAAIPDPNFSCTSYFPEVHVVNFGPALWRGRWLPTASLGQLVYVLGTAGDAPPGAGAFDAAELRRVVQRTGSRGMAGELLEAVTRYLRDHGAPEAARKLRAFGQEMGGQVR